MNTVLWYSNLKVAVQRHVVSCQHLNRGPATVVADTASAVEDLIERDYIITDAPCVKKEVK